MKRTSSRASRGVRTGLILAIFLWNTNVGIYAQQKQQKQYVKWQVEASPVSKRDMIVTFTVVIDKPWHIYSQHMDAGGPLPTSFKFSPSKDYSLVGKVTEVNNPIKKFDSTFLIPVAWFEETAVFKQRVRVKKRRTSIACSVEFMACSADVCLLPEEKKFTVNIKQEMTQ
jgi:hypothetical protein